MEVREAELIPTAVAVSGILTTIDVEGDDGPRHCLTLHATNGWVYEIGVVDRRDVEYSLRCGHILQRHEMTGLFIRSSSVLILEFPRTERGLAELSASVYCSESSPQSPYIPQAHTPVVSDDHYYLVLPIPLMGLPPHDLFEHVSESPVFPIWNTESIFMQILIGLDSLHRRGIFHRLISLESILLPLHQHHGDVHCLIFSNSHALRMPMYDTEDQDEGGTRVYRQRVDRFGIPLYMAPELLNNGADSLVNGVKVDLWSLGIILFILLTGKSNAFVLVAILLLICFFERYDFNRTPAVSTSSSFRPSI
jgi:serine/threonine protein kinase